MDEVFVLGLWVFDIAAARTLIAERPRDVVTVPVAYWAHAYGLDLAPGARQVPLVGAGTRFDAAFALTADLTIPVIVAILRDDRQDEQPLLIDGTHRVYRAHRDGVTHLPGGYVLTADETHAIRHTLPAARSRIRDVAARAREERPPGSTDSL